MLVCAQVERVALPARQVTAFLSEWMILPQIDPPDTTGRTERMQTNRTSTHISRLSCIPKDQCSELLSLLRFFLSTHKTNAQGFFSSVAGLLFYWNFSSHACDLASSRVILLSGHVSMSPEMRSFASSQTNSGNLSAGNTNGSTGPRSFNFRMSSIGG